MTVTAGPSGGVSVVIPTWNRRAVLPAAIESARCQTLPALEIIVVDDGSDDGSWDLLQALATSEGAPPLRVFSQPNRGPAAARNFGVAQARGEFIAFLDSDDRWHSDKLGRQMALFAQRPELALVGCAAANLRTGRSDDVVAIGERDLLYRNWFLTPGVVVRRDVLTGMGGFAEDLRRCEDYDLWLRIAAARPCALLDQVLITCGEGKPGFGHSGLSADLDALREAESTVFLRWRRRRNPASWLTALVILGAWLRHWRRRILSASRTEGRRRM